MADHAAKTGVVLGNSAYDVLRRFVEIVLPGLGVFYAAIAQLWNLPYSFEVVGSTAALAVLGGVLLSASRSAYDSSDAPYDGAIVVDESDPENPAYRFQLDATDAETLLNKKRIVFKGVDSAT